MYFLIFVIFILTIENFILTINYPSKKSHVCIWNFETNKTSSFVGRFSLENWKKENYNSNYYKYLFCPPPELPRNIYCCHFDHSIKEAGLECCRDNFFRSKSSFSSGNRLAAFGLFIFIVLCVLCALWITVTLNKKQQSRFRSSFENNWSSDVFSRDVPAHDRVNIFPSSGMASFNRKPPSYQTLYPKNEESNTGETSDKIPKHLEKVDASFINTVKTKKLNDQNATVNDCATETSTVYSKFNLRSSDFNFEPKK